MEEGFTHHHSKGLFTFYREQAQSLKVTKPFPKTPKELDMSSKRHYHSVSDCQARKRSREKQLRVSANIDRQIKTERHSQRRPLSINNVFEPKIIKKSPRKNGFDSQLFGVKGRIEKSQIEMFLKKHIREKTQMRQIISQLSPSNKIKELFLPKKEHYAKAHFVKKNPLKLNAVSARSLQSLTQENHKKKRIQELKEENGKQFHMPIVYKDPKNNNLSSSSIFKNALQMRRHKLQNGSFWEEVRLKREIPSFRLDNRLNFDKIVSSWTPKQNNRYSTLSNNNCASTAAQQQAQRLIIQ